MLIDPEYGTAEEINSVFSSWSDGVGTSGATPTAATLDIAHDYLADLDSGNPGIILLITDGAPNCNDQLDGETCECSDDQTKGRADSNLCLDDQSTIDAADGGFDIT